MIPVTVIVTSVSYTHLRPPVIPGLGESGGLEMQLEARGEASWENLGSATETFMLYASKAPELTEMCIRDRFRTS